VDSREAVSKDSESVVVRNYSRVDSQCIVRLAGEVVN